MSRKAKPSTKPSARAAVGYTRVSTGRQAREGLSLPAQRSRILKMCGAHGWTFATLHTDAGVSGRKARNRPGLEAALQQVCDAKGVLIVYSLSRLARSAGDAERICERLQAAGADLVSVTEPIDTTTAMGRAFFGIVTVFARLESELSGERLAAVNAETVAELGYRTQGTQPAGWRLKGRQRVPCHEERRVIERIIKLRRDGATCREIAKRLNGEGTPTVSTRRGYKAAGEWHSGTVFHLLARHAADLTDLKSRRPPFAWTDKARQLLGTKSDAAVAERLGCSRITVIRERLRLGIESANPKNSPRR